MRNARSSPPDKNQPQFRLVFLHPRFWLTWLGLLLFFIFSLLPLSVINTAGERLGDYAARKNKKRFHIAKVNLSLCYPHRTEAEIEAMVRQHFRSYLRGLLQYGLIWWAPVSRLDKHIEVEGFAQIDELLAQNKNVIVLTCHSAGLEFTGVALARRYACSGPYKPMRNAVINWVVARGRTRLGTLAYTREEGFRPLIRDTRRGRVLIYLADEDLGPEVSVFAPFFGVPKATISVLGRLTKSCDAQVLPCISCYDSERSKYVIKVFPPLPNFPTGDALADATAMNKAVEKLIAECPIQYFWNLRLFQTRPPGEASVYD